jgi:predicted nucleic acid-binding protein
VSAVVLDCSATVAWCFREEASAASWTLLDRIVVDGALVPSLWPYEIGNVLIMAERRERLTEADVGEFLDLLARRPIELDPIAAERVLHDVRHLARSERLTAYDAAYLELAMRSGLPLATRERALARAATRSGVDLISI